MATLRTLLAQNIKNRRKYLGISQAQLAEKVSTSANYIAQIEQQNRFPTPEMLERIAEALEIESHQLFATETNYDEIISQFTESFLSDIGITASRAAFAKMEELKKGK